MSAIEHMVAAYQAGATATAIAAEHKLPVARVYRTLKQAGVQIRKPGRQIGMHYTPTRDQAMADQYMAGATLEQVGAGYGLTRERVRQILERLGVQRRPSRTGNDAYYTQLRSLTLAAHEAGETRETIAARLGVSVPWVCNVLRVAGYTRSARTEQLARLARVRALFNAGLDVHQIMTAAGFSSRVACYAALNRMGLRFKDRAAACK